MSLWSSIKAVGRAVDPTNASAPLGSLVGKAADLIAPGSSAALSGLGAANKAASAAKAKAPSGVPLTTTLSDKLKWFTTPVGMGVGLAAVAGLVALLFYRRK
jgi:hypothetical protein